MTPYEVLGVSPSASDAEIRRAYLALARRHHPDFQSDADTADRVAAERQMQRINEAWQLLGDTDRRADYDRLAAEPHGDPVPDDRWTPSGGPHPDFVPLDDDDTDYSLLLDQLDASPYRNARAVPRWQQLLPAALLVVALACLSVGLVVNIPSVLALGVLLLVAAGASFVLTPMLAVLRSHERDPD